MEEEQIGIDTATLNQKIKGDPDFAEIVDVTQSTLGHALSRSDLNTLFGIYDHLGLPCDVFMLLINRCAEDMRRRYGKGRLLTMRAIEKEACVWHNRGIATVEQAKEYLDSIDRREERMEHMLQLLHIQNRPFSSSERQYLEQWLDMDFPDEVLALAYDRTVMLTGKLVLRYMDAILRSWQEKGLRTVDDVKKEDPQRSRRKDNGHSEEHPTAKNIARLVGKKILTPDKIEEFLSAFYDRERQYDRLWAKLGIPGEPNDSQKVFLASWTAMELPDEVLALAYERTIRNTGDMAWSYMDAILQSWRKNGLRTVDDIKEWSAQYWKDKGKIRLVETEENEE